MSNEHQDNPPLWPSGKSIPVLEIAYSTAQLKALAQDAYERALDNLDWCERGYFLDQEIGYVTLIKYENMPSGGTILYVDSAISNVAIVVEHLLTRLKPLGADVLWRAG
jgi:pimeloyl-CoA synthetase